MSDGSGGIRADEEDGVGEVTFRADQGICLGGEERHRAELMTPRHGISTKRGPKAATPDTTIPSRIPTHFVELRPLRLVLRLTALVLFGAVLFAWARPEWRTWGVHHLAFLPPLLAGLLVCLAVLLWTPAGGRLVGWLFSRLRGLSGRPALLWAIVAALFFSFRASVPLLGDGQLWITELKIVGQLHARGTSAPLDRWKTRKEPLEMMLHEMVFRTALLFRPPDSFGISREDTKAMHMKREKWFTAVAKHTYASLSILAGALIVLMAVRFSRRRIAPQSRALFLLTLFSGGSILLFFGYIEHYSWTSLAVMAFLMAGLEESFSPRRFPLKTTLAFLLAVGCHLMAFILLPALLYLLYNYYKWPSDVAQARTTVPRNRAFFFLAIFIFIGLAGYLYVNGWKGRLHILPLLPAFSRDGYALLSLNHGLDLLNLLALIALPAVILLVTVRIPEKVEYFERVQSYFLVLAAASGVAFAVNVDPDLGAARDWDAFAVALWPLVFLAAWKMARIDLGTRRAEIVASLASFAAVISIPYVLVQTGESSAIARFESLLRMDHSRSAYGWENLALHCRSTGDTESCIRAWKAAIQTGNNPRYMINLAIELRLAKRLEEAETYCVNAARRKPEYSVQLVSLAMDYADHGAYEKSRELLALAGELNPTDSTSFRLLERINQEIARRDSVK